MRSKIATELLRQRGLRTTAMTPAERVELALRLGESGLASYMALHHVDRRTARRQIEATRRAGRRHSSSAAPDDD